MITKKNYFDKVQSIDYKSLPEALKEGYDTIKFGSKDYTTWEYLEDDPEFLNLYFGKLLNFMESETVKPKRKTSTESKGRYEDLEVEIRPKSPRSKLFIVWDVKKDMIFANEYFKSIEEAKEFTELNKMKLIKIKKRNTSNRKARSVTPRSKVIKKAEPKKVEMIPLDISFIRRYALLHGKTVTKKRLLTLLNSLQKAMLEKRIRKTSPYAKELMNIQDQLIKVIGKMDEQVEINIEAKNLEAYKEIASSERIRESIALLKRYISIHGKPGVEEKALRLKLAMERMVKNGKITKHDNYASKLDAAYKSLISFINENKPAPAINQGELNGIKTLIGESLTEKETPKAKGNRDILSSQDLLKMKFETIGLKGKYKELIGDPSVGFTSMVFGQPKSGKSTLMLQFAHELAKNHGKVLYAAIEEGYGYTLKEKIERVGAAHANLEFSEKLPGNLSHYDFVFVDSVSRAGMELEDLVKLKNKYPKTGFIFIFHSTKDGKFRGGNDLAHEVDVIIEVEPGLAKASGRFNGGGEMRV